MFGFLKRKRRTLIGMDIGSHVVKCLRLDLSGERPQVTHFGMADLPPEAIVDGEIMDRELVIQTIREAAQTPDMKAKLLLVAQNVEYQSNVEFARLVRDDQVYFAKLLKDLDIKLE